MSDTNFNFAPYFDDYTELNHFYKILFKPGVAVQAREMTQAQTILQQQISFFGDASYKHGSMVIPGQIAIDPGANYVCLSPTYNNTPVNLSLLSGQTIVGSITGLTAQVLFTVDAVNSDSPTLYVKYLTGGTSGSATEFVASETLSIAGTPLATTTATNCAGGAVTAQINSGVYYIHGIFCRVEKQFFVVSKYNNIVSTRVGLTINESIANSLVDPTLLDISQGSPNYTAPGADRYKIDLVLDQRPFADFTNDSNFVELVRLKDSVRQTLIDPTEYSIVAKQIAQQASDTNGDFVVRNFAMDVREHLDTSFVTSGIVVASTQATTTPVTQAATVTLAATASSVDNFYKGMQFSIVNGQGAGQIRTVTSYAGDTRTVFLDSNWDTLKQPNSQSQYQISDLTKINRGLYPPAPFGIGDAAKLAVGLESGRAYVDGYLINTLNTDFLDVNKAQDFTQTQNAIIPTQVGNYIYVKNLSNIALAASSAQKNFLTIAFSNVKANGSFSGINQLGTAKVHAIEYVTGTSQAAGNAIYKMYLFDIQMNTNANINSVRSFYLSSTSNNTLGNSDNAWGDVLTTFGILNMNGAGLLPGQIITGPAGIGEELVVSYDAINNLLLTESTVGNTTQILTFGIIGGPGTAATVTSRTQLFDPQHASLIYPVSTSLVKAIRSAQNVTNTSYYVRRMFEATRNSSGNFVFSTSSVQPFAPFNTTDYMACIAASSNSGEVGKIVDLNALVSSGSFSGSPANTTLTISIPSGLGSTPGCVLKLMATVIKEVQGEKTKTLTTSTITVPTPTSVISLGKADIYRLISVVDSVAGDVTALYTLDNGQRDYFYDRGSISLNVGSQKPNGTLTIQFQYFNHSGTGDYFSVDSYSNQVSYTAIASYTSSTGTVYDMRNCLDFRSRISDDGLNFANSGSSFSETVRPNDVVRADYQYYLGRIDKIYVDKNGVFNLIEGNSAVIPVAPANPVDGMLLYTISLNPYTQSPSDLSAIAANNQLYTMKDVSALDTRISNLEQYTTLNRLEQSTTNTIIPDALTGLDRFKSGFLTDSFVDTTVGDISNFDYAASINAGAGQLRPAYNQDNVPLVFQPTQSNGFQKAGDLLLLPYSHEAIVTQPFATTIEDVNPFAVYSWVGNISLNPSTDDWKDTTQPPDVLVPPPSAPVTVVTPVVSDTSTTPAGFTGYLYGPASPFRGAFVQQYINGVLQRAWADWQINWSGLGEAVTVGYVSGFVVQNIDTGNGLTNVSNLSTVSNTQSATSTPVRSGTVTTIPPQTNTQTVAGKEVSTESVPYIRSRTVAVVGRGLKPFTRVFPFFDGVNVSANCAPTSVPVISPTLPNGVLNDPLVTDGSGNITLNFTIPNSDALRFRTGTRVFRLTASSTDDDTAVTFADANYTAAGILDSSQGTIDSVRPASTFQSSTTPSPEITLWVDPLAETFQIANKGGAFISKVDLFFFSMDQSLPVTLQIREVVNGYPGPTIVPFSTKSLYPNNPSLSALTANGLSTGTISYTPTVINVSTDGSVPTTFEFDSPVYLKEHTDYCLVLMADTVNYKVFTAVLGQNIFGSNSIVSQQPYAGVFFMSQNGSTWTANQNEDLKFTIYRAVFDTSVTGTISLTNGSIPTDILPSYAFHTQNGSNVVRVTHPNHNMPQGQSVQSSVTISNVATGTYNGLSASQLSGTFLISNVNMDSYTIVVSGAAANATSYVGPAGVIATKNRQYDTLYPSINQFVLSQTEVDWQIKTTSGKSVSNLNGVSQTPYIQDAAPTPIAVNDSTSFTSPRLIANDLNETLNITGGSALARKSLNLLGSISTTVDNLSPVIDTGRMSVVVVSNRLDDPTFASNTISGMDNGLVVPATNSNTISFASQTNITVSSVTGGVYSIGEQVTGARSGVTATVVSFDSIVLTVSSPSGKFLTGEAIQGFISDVTGTVVSVNIVNTITNPSGGLDFSGFMIGHYMTISGAVSNNNFSFSNPVLIQKVLTNGLMVNMGSSQFVTASGETAVVLIQYNSFVSEIAPSGCTTAGRYLTKPFSLATQANAIRVTFNINCPIGSFVDVYYKILPVNSNDSWDTQLWNLMTLDSGVDNASTSNLSVFKPYSYTTNNIGEFATLALKIVFRGSNSSQPPRIESLVAIALGT